jgi:Polyphosphate kinase
MPTAVAKTSAADEPSAGIEVLRRDAPAANRFSDPRNFINRELSWLEFNRRVLEEAQDPTQPLIERVKFLTIFSSNLDEFFEIRVAGIKQQIESETSEIGPDGLSPTETFNRIQKTVRGLVATRIRAMEERIAARVGKARHLRARNCGIAA